MVRKPNFPYTSTHTQMFNYYEYAKVYVPSIFEEQQHVVFSHVHSFFIHHCNCHCCCEHLTVVLFRPSDVMIAAYATCMHRRCNGLFGKYSQNFLSPFLLSLSNCNIYACTVCFNMFFSVRFGPNELNFSIQYLPDRVT